MLKSLEEENNRRRGQYLARGQRLNGIACPSCGHELADTNPDVILTSNPPQTHTHCPVKTCGYRGYRVI